MGRRVSPILCGLRRLLKTSDCGWCSDSESVYELTLNDSMYRAAEGQRIVAQRFVAGCGCENPPCRGSISFRMAAPSLRSGSTSFPPVFADVLVPNLRVRADVFAQH